MCNLGFPVTNNHSGKRLFLILAKPIYFGGVSINYHIYFCFQLYLVVVFQWFLCLYSFKFVIHMNTRRLGSRMCIDRSKNKNRSIIVSNRKFYILTKKTKADEVCRHICAVFIITVVIILAV